MQLPDLFDDRGELLLLGLVDHVRIVRTDHRHIGRNHDDFEFVYLAEFFRFGIGGPGHPRQFAIHAEIVLEGDRGHGLVFRLDLYPLLGLEGLVQAVAVSPARHHPTCKFIDDDDLPLFDEVVYVALE